MKAGRNMKERRTEGRKEGRKGTQPHPPREKMKEGRKMKERR
jgi:hypothetical protein